MKTFKVIVSSSIDEEAQRTYFVRTVLSLGLLADIIKPLTPYNLMIVEYPEKDSMELEEFLLRISTLQLYSTKPLKY
jgi:hypothetical protein